MPTPPTINDVKERGEGLCPLFLFDFAFSDGSTLSLCSHAVTYGGVAYAPRMMDQRVDAIQALSPQGIDVPGSMQLTLADADKDLWAIELAKGFRGVRVQVTFGFYNFDDGTWSETIVPFLGRGDRPQVDDETLQLTAGFILNLEAKMLPSFPVQPRCPKPFPGTTAQKVLAAIPGTIYYPCGVTDPTKTFCTLDKAGCAANGNSPRFSGFPYEVPPASSSREYASGNWLSNLVSDNNAAKYGDWVQFGYGTAWVDCLVIYSYPDANSTRGEAIVCEGRPAQILKVTVNDEIVPCAQGLDGSVYGVADPLMRYNVIAAGDRDGAVCNDAPMNGQGDPHGSVCVIEWCVYHKLTDATPRVRALVQFGPVKKYLPIDSIVGGVVTFAGGMVNRDCAGNAPYTVRIFGNSNGALNGTFGLTTWNWGPPGTVTLAGTAASGTGGYVEYLGSSDSYAWAIRDLLARVGLAFGDTHLDSFIGADQKFQTLTPYVTTYVTEFASGVTYGVGAVVSYSGQSYQSLQDNNTGNEPDLSPDWWAVTAAPPSITPVSGAISWHAMFTCSMVVRQRRAASDILTGMLRGCCSHLGRDLATGKVGLFARGTLAEQQPVLPDGSNYATAIAGGFVAYHFDESSIVRINGKSTFMRLGVAAAGVPNVVTVPFVNEENDYSGDSAQVSEPDDIDLMGQEVTASLQVDGCSALERAQRVGSTFLAEQLGGEVYRWQTTAKAVKLMVGQIVAVSNAKYGYDKQLMRVQKVAPDANWKRCTIDAALHDDGWYAVDLTKSSPATPGQARSGRTSRPPAAWQPNAVQPASGDPLYGTSDWTFGLRLGYQALGSGDLQPVVAVTGAQPVTAPSALVAPVLGAQGSTASSGGSIAGSGRVYFIAVASRDADGLPGPVSAACQVVVAQGGASNTITAPVKYWDPNGSGYFVFVGTSPALLSATNAGGYAGAPASVTVTAIPERTWAPPDAQCAALVARPKLVWHGGVFGAAISGVATRALTIAGAGWTANEWAGYDCMVVAKADLSAVGLLEYRVASNTATVLTIDGASPDPDAAGIAPGDVLLMLSKPTVGGLTLTDAKWQNSLSNAGLGLTAHQERGRMLRVIAGTGRGYRYAIADNTPISITVVGPWIVAPDATSRYVIEDAGDLPDRAQWTATPNGDPAAGVELDLPVANYAGKTLLVEVVTLDAKGTESAPQNNPVGMIYVPGAQGTRPITSSGPMLATDSLVSADAAAGAITYTSLAFALVPNQTFTVMKSDASANTVGIQLLTGDTFDDGTDLVVLSNQGDSFTFRVHG
jgi:hypothetical protein